MGRSNLTDEERRFIEETRSLLAGKAIDARVILHSGWGKETGAVSRMLGAKRGNVLKCVLFLDRNGEPLLAVVLGDHTVDLGKLSEASGRTGLSLARAKEVERITGHRIGGVPPFRLKLPIFFDKRILDKDKVYASAGSPYAGIEIRPKDILRISRAEVVDIGRKTM